MAILHFSKLRTLFLFPVVLAMLFAVACGGTAAEPIVVEKEVVKEVVKEVPVIKEVVKEIRKEVVVEKEVVKEVERLVVATAVPAVKAPTAETKLPRLVVAVAAQGWDSNYSYKVGTGGLLDKYPVQEWLIGLDRETGAHIPELATEWEMAPNGKDWTFKLREGVTFSEGPHSPPGGWGEFTAEDVKHSLWLTLHPESIIGQYRKFAGVKKSSDVATVTQQIEKVATITDDHTITFNFNVTVPEISIWIVKGRQLPMESKARWDSIGHDGYVDAIVGTGPFKFVERIEGVHVLYESRGEDHWRIVPDYNELEFRWVGEGATRLATLLTGEVHVADIDRASHRDAESRGMKIINTSGPALAHRWHFGGLWWTEPDKMDPKNPMLNPKVRWAMNKAVNREAIAEALLGGVDRVRIPWIYGYDRAFTDATWPGAYNPKWGQDWDEYYGYDPERAKQLLAEAGYPNGFEFTMYIYPLAGLPESVDIGQAMALDFESIGLKPKMVGTEYGRVKKWRRSQDSGLNNSLMHVRAQTQANRLLDGYRTQSSNHIFQTSRIDELAEMVDATVDKAERSKLFRELGDISFYDHAILQMFGVHGQVAVNPAVVSEYIFPGPVSGVLSHLEYIKTVPR
jgi:peptide/nickel transport system substrate-binding protein